MNDRDRPNLPNPPNASWLLGCLLLVLAGAALIGGLSWFIGWYVSRGY